MRRSKLPDVLKSGDSRGIPLRVGPRAMRVDTYVLVGSQILPTIAKASAYVSLHPDHRGCNMSRFGEVIGSQKVLDYNSLRLIAATLRQVHEVTYSLVHFAFPLSVYRVAPLSGKGGRYIFDAELECEDDQGKATVFQQVEVYVGTSCPCSKEITACHAGHSQRAKVTLRCAVGPTLLSWEDMVGVASDAGSSWTFSILKREDEKVVSERLHAQPKFVEDVARDVILGVKELDRVLFASVMVESEESIHPYNVVAWGDIDLRKGEDDVKEVSVTGS